MGDLLQLVNDGKITPNPGYKHPLAYAVKVLTSLRQSKVMTRAVFTASSALVTFEDALI
jgi:D-arabinose 1-dehydrogenase-like Zn-dependent alcohol dehydrogenase